MNRFAARILLGGILALSLNQAFAHFKFLEPPSALVTENGGKGAPPCGEKCTVRGFADHGRSEVAAGG